MRGGTGYAGSSGVSWHCLVASLLLLGCGITGCGDLVSAPGERDLGRGAWLGLYTLRDFGVGYPFFDPLLRCGLRDAASGVAGSLGAAGLGFRGPYLARDERGGFASSGVVVVSGRVSGGRPRTRPSLERKASAFRSLTPLRVHPLTSPYFASTSRLFFGAPSGVRWLFGYRGWGWLPVLSCCCCGGLFRACGGSISPWDLSLGLSGS